MGAACATDGELIRAGKVILAGGLNLVGEMLSAWENYCSNNTEAPKHGSTDRPLEIQKSVLCFRVSVFP